MFDHHLITERYFFPRPDYPEPLTTVSVDGATLGCYVKAPHAAAPILVHFHGNGEVVADYVPDWVDAFVDRGINVFLAEFRGYGASTGVPALATMLDDVTPIFEAAAKVSDRVIVYGRSVGSIYAIELAKRHPEIAGLVLESSIADPLERIIMRVSPEELGASHDEVLAEIARVLDHKAKIEAFGGPVLVFHARYDLLNVSHGERLARWAGENGEFVCFERGDHNTVMAFNHAEIVSRVVAFAV